MRKTTKTATASVVAALAGIGITTVTSVAAQERGDRDGPFADGVLTRAEASQMALDRFDRVDTNADGFVSEIEREEAKAAAEARRAERGDERRGRRGGQRGDRSDRGGDRLALADTNDDGFVSRDEVREAALARFDAADADGDGEVTREEMRAQRASKRGGRR